MSLLDTPKLGFGLMRLPTMPGDPDAIDIEQTKKMVDLFMQAGLTYFDTAFVYGKDGASEKAAKEALVDRYPRDSFTLATKINAFLMAANEEECKRQFRISLERTGAGYFDFYLLHALQTNNYKKYDEYGIWDYVKGLKEEGLIKNYGFSFHATPQLLDEILTLHPDVDFIQLQINYADWENPGVASRRNWEICRAHGKPVIVMEPVKGGILADPIPEVRKVFDEAAPGVSYASWALRFACELEDVHAVLSGMSSLAQMEDNLKTMSPFRKLDGAEMELIHQAQKALDEDKSIPCTSCHYCTMGCPMEIPIPEIFNVENRKKGSPRFRIVREYDIVTQNRGRASSCIACGQCEAACPQQLPIIRLLQECRAEMED